jgi:putative membrane protein
LRQTSKSSKFRPIEGRNLPLNTPIKPDETLLHYYFVASLFWLVFFPIVFTFRYIRYRTLRYTFTDKEITMSWGGIHKQSISVSYERIQDVQLSSGPLERQFSLAKVQLQTASGDANAEIVLEGFLNPAEVRDQLYKKIQQAKNPGQPPATAQSVPAASSTESNEIAQSLQDIALELKAIRSLLAKESETE